MRHSNTATALCQVGQPVYSGEEGGEGFCTANGDQGLDDTCVYIASSELTETGGAGIAQWLEHRTRD